MAHLIFTRFGAKLSLLLLLLAGSLSWAPGVPVAQAACSALPSDKGTDTMTITAPATGTYRVWSRIKAPDATNNTFLLQVDQTTCNISVGGGGAIPASTWTWVNYQNGSTQATVDVSLTSGAHTVILAGASPNVEVDRLIFTTDTACVPTGTGDNCATTSTPTPTASVSTTLPPTTSPTPSPSGKVGDINGDNAINVFDLSILLSRWNTTDPAADLNHDGTVNVFDLSILLSHWGI